MAAVSFCAVVLVCVVLMVSPCADATERVQLFRPLPFAGPHRGTVADSEKGTPIPGASVEVEWKRHDNPLPDGPGHHAIKALAKTDPKGLFNIEKQEARGGVFATNVTVTVIALGYIKRVLIIDPKGAPLPQQTIDWPFQDTSVHISPPEPLNVWLKPALPIIRNALQSEDPLIRQTAEEELGKLKHGEMKSKGGLEHR